MLAMQVIEYCRQVFLAEGLEILLKPYQIICTGSQTGLIEFLEDTISVDRMKKSYVPPPLEEYPFDPSSSPGGSGDFSASGTAVGSQTATLKDYFESCFGPSYTFVHSQAINNFVSSLVGYSLVTYLLQVKDRHNANILVARDGSVIHIDFGFILGGKC